MANSLDERVAEGIKHLDANHPDWYDVIDLQSLNMRDSRCCILGQIDGLYWRYLCESFLGENWAIAHGFTLPSGEFVADAWRQLTDLWYAATVIRRNKSMEA